MSARMRHPMLPAVRIWVIAHLLVNGDLVSILMFGSMLGWAVWSYIKINHTKSWEWPEVTDNGRNSMYLDLLVGTFSLMTGILILLGVAPFGTRG